jgi:beta-lactamase class A
MHDALSTIEATLGGGTLGVAATYLPTQETVLYNATTVFPTASTIKVAIIAELLTQAAEGRLALTDTVPVLESDQVAGSGVLAELTPGTHYSLRDLAFLAIAISDNTASNLCLRAVGGKDVVNARIREAWGMNNTQIYRPIQFHLSPTDPPFTATGTPQDFLHLMTLIATNKLHSEAVSTQLRTLLTATHDDSLLPRFLSVNPFASALNADAPTYTVMHKPGMTTGVRNDAGIIVSGEKRWVMAVFTKDCPDNRWTPENAGVLAVGRVAKSLVDIYKTLGE